MTEKDMTREELIAMRNRDVSLSYEQSQSVLRMIKKLGMKKIKQKMKIAPNRKKIKFPINTPQDLPKLFQLS